MQQTLRMGVIGCGAIAQIMHIPYLVEHERFQLVSLCDMYEPVLNEVADRYHVDNRYTDYRDLLAYDNLGMFTFRKVAATAINTKDVRDDQDNSISDHQALKANIKFNI